MADQPVSSAELKKLRMPVRTRFTKAFNELETEIKKKEVKKADVEKILRRLQTHHEKLSILDMRMEEALLRESVSEDIFTAEYESVCEYEDNFSNIMTDYEALAEKDAVSTISGTAAMNYRLPKLEFKKFGGEPREWITFWSQFSTIDRDPQMPPETKFQYLFQATAENSEAREAVESFPPSADNYPKVIEYIKSHFGEDEMLVEIYVRDLLQNVIQNVRAEGKMSVVKLYDRLETQLQALETLGVARDKFAAMLYPLVESALPEDTLRVWERSQYTVSGRGVQDKLTQLMTFLKTEVKCESRVNMAKAAFKIDNNQDAKDDRSNRKSLSKKNTGSKMPTATDLADTTQIANTTQMRNNCIFCGNGHPSQECNSGQRMHLPEKKDKAKGKNVCFWCLLPGHGFKKCRIKPRCPVCGGKHYPIMCPTLEAQKTSHLQKAELKVSRESPATKQETANQFTSTTLNNATVGGVYLQTLIVKISRPKGKHNVRVLLDCGSQRSYISKRMVDALGLKRVQQVTLTHNLFGGGEIRQKKHNVYKVNVSSLNNEYMDDLKFLDQEVICGHISQVQDHTILNELKARGINLTDICQGEEISIHMLIGSDLLSSILTGRMQILQNGVVATETKLGWTVMGPAIGKDMEDACLIVTSFHVNSFDVQDLWKLDVLGIMDAAETKSRKDLIEASNTHFKETVKRDESGRYIVSLPWIAGHPPVPVNRRTTENRLLTTTRNVQGKMLYEKYDTIFEEWEKERFIEEVEDKWEECSYLPHRPVLKDSHTTPIRPVFDASCKKMGLPSLNQYLEKGDNLIELIPDLLLRFRLGKYGIIADMRKAFLQIQIREEDREFLRFLWWKKDQKTLKFYRHCRVVFGLTSSPFLLAATIKYHLSLLQFQDNRCAELLARSFYVDNCILSLSSTHDVKKFIKESSDIMMQAKFELRDWMWNEPGITEQDPTSILGMKWHLQTDTIAINVQSLKNIDEEKSITKRIIVSLGKNGYKWNKNHAIIGRTRSHNIITHLPGLKGPAKPKPNCGIDIFNLFFTAAIIKQISEFTNAKIEEFRQRISDLTKSTYSNFTSEIEIRAFSGLLYLAGVYKSGHENVESLFASDGTGRDIFRSVMSVKRFPFLLLCIRFDNFKTRCKEDRLSPIRDISQTIIEKFKSCYTPAEYLTVDEMLVGFREKCPFKIYIPSKPNKYGIKIVILADSRTHYMYNAMVYTGKSKTPKSKELSLPTQIVLDISRPLWKSNRNITADNWFTSIELVEHGLTYLGTMRKNKPQNPPQFQPHPKRESGTSIFGFSGTKTLVSYVPKKRKSVILISSMHHDNKCDETTGKPDIIMDYNLTKGGVDTIDQMVSNFSTSRRSRRWPLALFYALLDITALNSYIIFNYQIDKKDQKERSTFIVDLRRSLIDEHLATQSLYTKYFEKIKLNPASVALKSYTQQAIDVLGDLPAKIKHGNIVVHTLLHVVRADSPILGLELFNKLGLSIKDGKVNQITESSKILETLPFAKDIEYKIFVDTSVPPVQQKLRRLPPVLLDEVHKEIQRLVKMDINEPIVTSKWISPIVVSKKKDGSIRLCVDLREPNKAVILDAYPISLIEDILSSLLGCKVFTNLDLSQAYHQIRLQPDSRYLTAFITHMGIYQFKRLPYGLSSAPGAFQRYLSELLMDIKGVSCYLDDIIIGDSSMEDHDKKLNQVLSRLKEVNLMLNDAKSIYRQKSLKFLGHIIDDNGVHLDEELMKPLLDAPPPKDKSGLRSLIGMINWFQKYIPNKSTIMEPLQKLLKKSVPFKWRGEHAKVLQTVKDSLKKGQEKPTLLNILNNQQRMINKLSELQLGMGQERIPVARMDIEKFNGRNMEPSIWITNFEVLCENNNWKSCRTRINGMRAHLEDMALAWYDSHDRSASDEDWEEWRKDFVEAFQEDPISKYDKAIKWQYRNGSYVDYFYKKLRLLQLGLPGAPEKVLITGILHGLPVEMQQRLAVTQFATLMELRKVLERHRPCVEIDNHKIKVTAIVLEDMHFEILIGKPTMKKFRIKWDFGTDDIKCFSLRSREVVATIDDLRTKFPELCHTSKK
ncbi:hypothetical protein LAZ67_18001024 [Cordylochernes scorpioides]|uniref:Reverse transcriptase domain-containing protein n=1 Tax=Cordylochernes scorpioides TaxID=51811 RepID=A0ABY6LGU8_9ARAC|nr:hypothetical protein LAZ67_18001024 [Cordylochernes scorpioides]